MEEHDRRTRHADIELGDLYSGSFFTLEPKMRCLRSALLRQKYFVNFGVIRRITFAAVRERAPRWLIAALFSISVFNNAYAYDHEVHVTNARGVDANHLGSINCFFNSVLSAFGHEVCYLFDRFSYDEIEYDGCEVLLNERWYPSAFVWRINSIAINNCISQDLNLQNGTYVDIYLLTIPEIPLV